MNTRTGRLASLRDLTNEEWQAGALAVGRWLKGDASPLSAREEVACANAVHVLVNAALDNGDDIDKVRMVIEKLGGERWEMEVNLVLFGRNEAELGQGQRTHKSILAGLARRAEDGTLESPKAFLSECLANAAVNAWRKESAPGPDASPSTLEGANEGRRNRRVPALSAPTGDELGMEAQPVWDRLGQSDRDAGGPTVAPTALPARVANVFVGSAELYALMVRLGEGGEGPLADSASCQAAESAADDWLSLAGHLRWHIALGPDRPRWNVAPHDVLDNHARAWEARYYVHDGWGAYSGADEIPHSTAPKRGLFDQHAARFRIQWGAAVQSGEEATAAYGLREFAGVRVPFSLDPPHHATLIGRTRKAS